MASVVAAEGRVRAATRRQPIAAGGRRGRGFALVGERPDWTLEEFVAALHSRECRAAAARSGVFWSVTTSASELRAAEQQRADVAGRAGIGSGSRPCLIHPALSSSMNLVTTTMARRYGRCRAASG